MTKTEALDLFDGKTVKCAEAVGVTYQAISQWPEELPQRLSDRVIAAAYRKGLLPPREKEGSAA